MTRKARLALLVAAVCLLTSPALAQFGSAKLSGNLVNVDSWHPGSNTTFGGGGSYTFTSPAGNLTNQLAVENGALYVISWQTGAVPSDTCGGVRVHLGAAVSNIVSLSCSDTGIFPRSVELQALTTGAVTVSFEPQADWKGHLRAISVFKLTTSPIRPSLFASYATGPNALNDAPDTNSSTVPSQLWHGTGDFDSLGVGNTATGYNALARTSSGYDNDAHGAHALENNTSGFGNVSMGFGSGQANREGYRGTFVGWLAGHGNTTGARNTFVGDEAGYANTAGRDNVAIGVSCFQDNVTGKLNTCAGVAALNFSNGDFNAAYGASAGQNLTGTSSNNTLLGTGAGQGQNLDGTVPLVNAVSNDTAVGENALFFTKNVSDNTALGFYAGGDLLQINNAERQSVCDTHMTFIGEFSTREAPAAGCLDDSVTLGYRSRAHESHAVYLGSESVTKINLFETYAFTNSARLPGNAVVIGAGTSTTNALMGVIVVPQGTGTEALVRLQSNKDENNTGRLDFDVNGAAASITASAVGSGTAITSLAIGGAPVTFDTSITTPLFKSSTACASSASPAVCAAAPSGFVTIAAAGTTKVVNTTAVSANSQVFITEDSSLGTALGVTCNTTTGRSYSVTARSGGTSFTITASGAPTTNPACLSFHVIN